MSINNTESINKKKDEKINISPENSNFTDNKQNTFIGTEAFVENIDGINNTAIGFRSQKNNISWHINIGIIHFST